LHESKRPDWLKVKAPNQESLQKIRLVLDDLRLHTVCESALCPNIGICLADHTITFMILGDTCTRNCGFCAVKKGKPIPPEPEEPRHIAEATKRLKLKHVVVTSVTRDDLEDLGAGQFARTIQEIRALNSTTTIEVLVPDFQGSRAAIETVVMTKPDIIGHNVEVVPRLYPMVRPEASYERSLNLLSSVKVMDPHIYTKSGLMLGLGENENEVLGVMKDLRSVKCDVLTIGQYLQPSKEHLDVKEFVRPEKFEQYRQIGYNMGFVYVASAPLIRSSFNAAKFSQKLMRTGR